MYCLISTCFPTLFCATVNAELPGKVIHTSGGTVAADARFYRSTVTGTGALTVPMLEHCIRLNKQIKSAGIKITEREATISQNASEIEQLNSYIDTNSAKVNTTRQDAVDTFNAKINQYSSTVTNYNLLLDKRNSDYDIYDGLYGRFKQECANKRYYDDDYQKAVKNVGFEMIR